jgi:hypothetical protein
MIELFDDFRDILVELTRLVRASSCWVVMQSRSTGTPALPRISLSWSKRIGRAVLIKNKRAAGRPQDIADVKALGEE